MSNYKCKFVFAALLSVVLLKETKALRCYTCLSSSTGDCVDPFDVTLHTQYTLENECEYNQACVKHKTPDTYLMAANLKRGCVPEDYCEHQYVSEYCSVCSWNLCNSSHVIVPSFLMVIVLLISSHCLFNYDL